MREKSDASHLSPLARHGLIWPIVDVTVTVSIRFAHMILHL